MLRAQFETVVDNMDVIVPFGCYDSNWYVLSPSFREFSAQTPSYTWMGKRIERYSKKRYRYPYRDL